MLFWMRHCCHLPGDCAEPNWQNQTELRSANIDVHSNDSWTHHLVLDGAQPFSDKLLLRHTRLQSHVDQSHTAIYMQRDSSLRDQDKNWGRRATCIGTILQQQLCCLCVPCSCSFKERCLTITVLGIDACAVAYEQSHSICIATVCSQVQRGCAILQFSHIMSTIRQKLANELMRLSTAGPEMKSRPDIFHSH